MRTWRNWQTHWIQVLVRKLLIILQNPCGYAVLSVIQFQILSCSSLHFLRCRLRPKCAVVAELADALAPGASGSNTVEVRVLSTAPP